MQAMITSHYLDGISLGALFLITLLILAVAIEVGFRLGNRNQGKAVKAQASQVRAIMGATLGLLAFMMAFTFATAQQHYETRVANMVEEARLANTAFLQADFLPPPDRVRAQALLREYIADRLSLVDLLNGDDALKQIEIVVIKAEAMQLELWELATHDQAINVANELVIPQRDPFMVSVIGLMDIQALRLQSALMNRIPFVLWLTLYLTAMLAMLVMGYQAGLVGRRSPMATMTLAVAFTAVMMLITDLDRPVMSMFQINNQVMYDLADRMDVLLERPSP